MKQWTSWIACVLYLVLGPAPATAEAADITNLIGEWKGRGTYEGAELALTREWSHDLGGKFLRADMRVLMTNGQAFRSLAFWKLSGTEAHDVVWMDEMGRVLSVQAVHDTVTGHYTIEYIDEFAGDGPAPRRWVFVIRGADSYVEWVYGKLEDGWEQLAEFSFERVKED